MFSTNLSSSCVIIQTTAQHSTNTICVSLLQPTTSGHSQAARRAAAGSFISVGSPNPCSQLPLGVSCVNDTNAAADSKVLASQSSVHVLAPGEGAV